MNPTVIGTWLGLIIAGGTAVAGTVQFLFWIFDEWQKRKATVTQGLSVPMETLRIAVKPEGNCWWCMGKMGDERTMQIVGSLFVTNISSQPVRVPQAELRYGFFGRKRLYGMVMVARSARENMHGIYDIPPNETRNAHFDFWLYPPVAEPGNPFIAHSVSLMDQFGNRHQVSHLVFNDRNPRTDTAKKQPEELIYAIADPTEREVVSVLKAETARYEMCGRRVGGLGSVHMVYKGSTFTGVGTDSWTPDSPVNQLIVPDPESASLSSDNLDALIGFYGSLDSEDKRTRFAEALIHRVGTTEYIAVSYFITAALWKIGRLADALQKAKNDLPAGDDKQFGLSNVLMLLNGVLKYCHTEFTSEMLDEIERTIQGLNEHTFMIRQKLAAIRANRLPRRPNA